MSVIGPKLIVADIADEATPDYDISDATALENSFHSQLHHFWFSARNAMIIQQLQLVGLAAPATILEVGCGAGTVLTHLRARGYAADGVDMHLTLCNKAATNCPEATVYCLDVLRGDATRIGRRYQAVGLFDVLEHIADTTPFLSACANLAVPDGLIVGTVPALPSLWSTYDLACGHKKRYSLATLRADLQAAGLRIMYTGYFFQCLVPAMWVQRHGQLLRGSTDAVVASGQGPERSEAMTLDRDAAFKRASRLTSTLVETMKVPARPMNAAFQVLCSIERGLSRILPLRHLPGASLFFAARI